MKKYIIYLMAVAVSALTLSSCAEKPAEDVTRKLYKTATIKARLLQNTDSFADPEDQVWSASDKLVVYAYTDNEDYDVSDTDTYGYEMTKCTYNAATGDVSVTVRVPENGIGVYFYVPDFEGVITKNVNGTSKEVKVMWYGGRFGTGLYPGDEIDLGVINIWDAANPNSYEEILEPGDYVDDSVVPAP